MTIKNNNTPRAITPVNGSAVDTLAPLFMWESSGVAEHYRVQIAADAPFREVVFDAHVGGTDNLTVYNLPLPFGGTYYWRVQATGVNTWSAPAVFSVGVASSRPAPPEKLGHVPAPAHAAPGRQAPAVSDAVVPPYQVGTTSHAAVMTMLMVMLFTVAAMAVLIWLGTPVY
jgi:hypothetical protein